MRQHYTPEPERRPIFPRDFFAALIFAALIGAPFVLYFWSMTP
jgi:hypothetical protein